PIALEDRLYLLKQVLFQVKAGHSKILKMNHVHLDLNLVIMTMAQHLLITFNSNIPDDKSIVTASLKEAHLVQAFAAFPENLGDYNCLYSPSEAVSIVKERIAQLESKLL
ncbi:MAG: hypothetical protein RSA71_01020, partial [Eubacterium sp.]